MIRHRLAIGITALGLQAAFGADASGACQKPWGDAVADVRGRAARRVAEIRQTPNPAVPPGASAYWVSATRGDDAADGRSPEKAWRTIGRLNAAAVVPGSYVLFERGGTYRGSVAAKAGVTYAPFGTGSQPRVVCSPDDGADPAKWRKTDAPRVWAYKIGRRDVGTLVFDDGAAHAIKVVIRRDADTGRTFDKRSGRPFRSYRDLSEDLTFWHDYYEKGTGELYLCSERNPGERFKSIEFNVKECCFRVRGPDVTIDGFEVRHAGVHGVAAGTCTNLTVRNCAFAWIGGSIQSEGIFGRDYPTRLGNGVEVYGGCENFTVSNCCFSQIYDAGVTHQFNIPEKAGARRFDQRHVRYVDNVFEKCNYSIEYFLTAGKGNDSLMEDVRFERNLMLDAGCGFCEQRPDVDTAAHVKAWLHPWRNRARGYVIRDNVFCLSKDMLIEACAGLKDGDRSSLPVLENNVFIGRAGDSLGNVTMRDSSRLVFGRESEAFLNSLGSGNRCRVLPAAAPEIVRVPDAPFPMPAFAVPSFPKRSFSITAFGARSDGSLCTEAFARAMAACEAAGGGRVIVPGGRWTTGPIRFRNNCDLHLDEHAVLDFVDDPSRYPVVDSTWEGVECRNLSPLLYAYGVTNVAITGAGVIAPRMDFWRTWFKRTPQHMKATEHLYHWCSTNAPLAVRDLTAISGSQVRPHLIQMNRVRGVLLDGFRIRESPFWTIHLYHSENCVVRHLNTFAHGHNNDGVDIEMTRNVLVEDCFFDQGDDGIVIKAGRNQDAWRLNRPTENVVVRNCTFVFAHSLLGIGSELSGGVRNIWMHDCKIGSSYNLLYVKTNRRRGGFVENIWIEDIDTESVRSALFGLKTDILYQWANFPDYELRYTRIAGINVRNVHARCADWAFDVTADEHLPVRGLIFENVTLDAARKGFSRIVNARDVKFRNVTMGDAEPTEWEQVVNETWHKGEGPGTYFVPPKGTDNVVAEVKHRAGAPKRTVAFLGGSITEMDGFRPRVMKLLREKYPSVDFVEISSGLSSTCSDTGAMRFKADILGQGLPDLLIVDEVVNDDQDGHFDRRRAVRGMEGVLRSARKANPAMALVVSLFVNHGQYSQLTSGKTPFHYSVHTEVARHYGAAVADVGGALAASAKAGGLDWKCYRDCHPSPEGCDFAAAVVMKAVDGVFDPLGKPKAVSLPPRLDAASYDGATFIPFGRVVRDTAWQVSRPDWAKVPGGKRKRFVEGDSLWTETDGATFRLPFRGTALAAILTAGPDAGDIEVSVDGGAWTRHRLFTPYSKSLHYPFTVLLAEGLAAGEHTVSVRACAAEREGKRQCAVRIYRLAEVLADVPVTP